MLGRVGGGEWDWRFGFVEEPDKPFEGVDKARPRSIEHLRDLEVGDEWALIFLGLGAWFWLTEPWSTRMHGQRSNLAIDYCVLMHHSIVVRDVSSMRGSSVCECMSV